MGEFFAVLMELHSISQPTIDFLYLLVIFGEDEDVFCTTAFILEWQPDFGTAMSHPGA